MLSSRRAAQLGLGAAAVIMLSSVAVLLAGAGSAPSPAAPTSAMPTATAGITSAVSASNLSAMAVASQPKH